MTTCSRLKVPNNVPNIKVSETNSAITKVVNVGGKLLDARLAYTNNNLLRALVPLATCISNIEEKTGKHLNTYLKGFDDSLRLVSAFNYINQMRKEVIRFHVHDTALSELYDCIFIADSDKELIDNVRYAVQLFDSVGLSRLKKICPSSHAENRIPWNYSKLLKHDCHFALTKEKQH